MEPAGLRFVGSTRSLPPPGDVLWSQRLSPGCGGACRTTRRGPEAALGLMLWGRNQHSACWQLAFALPSVTVGCQHAPGFRAAPRTDATPAAHHGTLQPRWLCSLWSRAWGFQVCRASSSIPRGCTQGEGHARGCCGQDLGSALWKAAPAAGREKPASILLPWAWEPNFPTPPGPSKGPNHPALTAVRGCWCPVLLLICFLC